MPNRFYVERLETCEAELLTQADGITVSTYDTERFPESNVYGPTPEAVIEYVRANWGDEDPEWFQEYVVDAMRRETEETLPDGRVIVCTFLKDADDPIHVWYRDK